MKKSCLIAFGMCLVAVCQAFGQTNKEYYEQFFEGSQKKDSTVIKDVISRWEKDFPNSCELLIARFNYYILKGMDEMLVTTVTPPRGNQQCLALKDSLGNECGYCTHETWVFVFKGFLQRRLLCESGEVREAGYRDFPEQN